MDGRASFFGAVCGLAVAASCRSPEPPPQPRTRAAQPSSPVKLHELTTDVANVGSRPTGFVTLGTAELFFTSDGALYASDGTADGTQLLQDPGPAQAAGDTQRLATLDGAAYWIANHGLWRTDGTAAGTSQIFGVPKDQPPAGPVYPVAFGDALYFAIGPTLYRSDGTTAGTQPLTDITTFGRWQAAGGLLYFAGSTAPDVGAEPSVTDGTPGGTQAIADLRPGNASSDPRFLGALGARALFSATTDGIARGLWITDGTSAGTLELVAPSSAQSAIADDALPAAILGDTAYLPCFTAATGNELCKTDGTVAGTSVIDAVPGAGALAPISPIALGGRIVFAGTTPAAGTELWSSDGTLGGTQPIVDLLAGTGSGFAAGRLVAVGATAYFAGHSAANTPNDLWKTDGTPAGTVRVAATQRIGLPQRTPLALGETGALAGQLVFSADDSVTGVEPWITDGTTAHLITDVIATRTQAQVRGFVAYQGATYLGTSSPTANRLWRTDGTTAGTASVVSSVVASQLTPAGASLFFFDLAGGMLWKTDGTSDGSQPLAATPLFSDAHALGNQLVFDANVNDATNRVWVSDGTPGGTRAVEPAVYQPHHIASLNGRAWLHGSSMTTSAAVPYASDPADPTQLAALCTQCAGVGELAAAGTVVVFGASDADHGDELWRSDGTAAGTALLVDLLPGTGSSAPDHVFSWRDKGIALFAATGPGGLGLWRTDGTAAGTTLLRNVELADPPDYVAWGNRVFFVATDDAGSELWRTDGTAAGTVRVADLYPGPVSSRPSLLTLAGHAGPLVFVADEPTTGRELWQLADPAGTPSLLADLAPGPRSSRPTAVTVQGTAIVAAADDGDGYALWKLDGVGSDGDPPTVSCPFDVGAIGDSPRSVGFPAPTATDDAGGTPTITIDHPSGSVFPAGETTVHVVATDDANNASACSFVVRVQPDGVTDGGPPSDDGPPGTGSGGGCSTGGAPGLLVLAFAALLRRRRQVR